MKTRYSFVILVCLSLLTGVISILGAIHESDQNSRKFCQVVVSLTRNPVPKPADPKANPSREQNWEVYNEFVGLRHSLGCKETDDQVQQGSLRRPQETGPNLSAGARYVVFRVGSSVGPS